MSLNPEAWTGMTELLRRRAADMLDQDLILERDRDNAELLKVLARILDGKAPHQAFGAPGDWGYGTLIGDALRKVYEKLASARSTEPAKPA